MNSASDSSSISAESISSDRTYSVVVDRVPVDELLFALARDTEFDIDIRPGLSGTVTLNAVKQTLPQILDRVADQVGLRYERDGNRIRIAPDTPFVKSYAVDYVNMARKLRSNVSISTSIATAGSVSGRASNGLGNTSNAEIVNTSDSQVWNMLERTVTALLNEHEGDVGFVRESIDSAPENGSKKDRSEVDKSAESNTDPARSNSTDTSARTSRVIVNPEAGLLTVIANSRQHKRVENYLARVQSSLGRQVLIEATLVEVILDENYQAGVDWSRIGDSLNISQSLTGNAFGSGPVTTLIFKSTNDFIGGTLNATVRLLETFGETRVLSSPKVMALNNQTALLKVVDEKVYFEIAVQRIEGTANTAGRTDYTSTIKSVPIGVMMTVTPQISRSGEILLNIRPTITRVTNYRADPVISLLGAKVDNLIPEIQVREIESTLKLASGQSAVLGGLMQENTDDKKRGIPFLMHLPLIGDLFAYRNDIKQKTELVIFLRPTVIEPSAAALAHAASAGPDESEQANPPLFASGRP